MALNVEALEERTVLYAQTAPFLAHQWITSQGILDFQSQFGPSEINAYLGSLTTSTQGENTLLMEGVFDEDESGENPFGQGANLVTAATNNPAYRHFWNYNSDFTRTFDDGLLGFDSAPNRAIKYFTGGLGLTGIPDPNWGDGQDAQTNVGIVAAYNSDDKTLAYYYFGHALHLLQDMTVPAHVLADTHLELPYLGTQINTDPYHDWVDGREFSTNPINLTIIASFDAPQEQRYKNWGYSAAKNGVGRILASSEATLPASSTFISSPLRAPSEVGDPTRSPSLTTQLITASVPASAQAQNLPLYLQFLEAAAVADDYDSRNAQGQEPTKQFGDLSQFDLTNYNNWTENELNDEADQLVPLAMHSTAEAIRFFYQAVVPAGQQAASKPEVQLLSTIGFGSPDSPQVVSGNRLTLSATATDQHTGDSGVGHFRLQFQLKLSDGSFGSWTDLNGTKIGVTRAAESPKTAKLSVNLNGLQGIAQSGQTYAFRFVAEDGAGFTGESNAFYARFLGSSPQSFDLGSLLPANGGDGSTGFVINGVAAGDRSGRFVSNAGDINGDGFEDVVIGADFADPNGSDSGSSYVVFGQADGFATSFNLSALDGSNGFRLEGVAAGDSAGQSVSSAGDINDDGFDDLLIGASGADINGSDSGAAYVVFGKASGFLASLNLATLNGTNGFRVSGIAANDRLGSQVSGAGDVNGDGFDDLLLGAGGAQSHGSYTGASYVVFGKGSGFAASMNLSSLDGSNGFRMDGLAFRSFLGTVSGAGDVNGDGFDDIVVAASGSAINGYNSGASYVVFGKSSPFSPSLDLSTLDGSNGFRLVGMAVNDISGSQVSAAGDFNGDGFDDILIGARDDNLGGDRLATFSVVFGKASGFSASVNLSTLDGTTGFILTGVDTDSRRTFSASGAGDVNGDGFDDLVIGESYADRNGTDSGASYLVFGKASGFAANMSLSALDGTNGFRLDGVAPGDQAGAVSRAGDVNGDGFDDLLVGAPGADPNGSSSGATYVVFGGNFNNARSVKIASGTNGGPTLADVDQFGFSVASMGDLDGDGVTDLAVGARYDGTGGFARGAVYVQFMNSNGTVKSHVKIASGTDNGPTLTNADSFGSSVASLGDLDGDGVTDLVVGAFRDDTGGTNRGAVHVLLLNANGTVKSSVKIASGTDNGPTLVNGDYFGLSVASLGDLDGDGVTDLAVGADEDDTGGPNRGAVHVLLLNANGTVKSSVKIASGTDSGPTLANSDRFGISVASLGDLDGDGVTDLAVGADYDDTAGDRRGAVHVLLLNANGTVKSSVKIASGTNGGPTLANGDFFGSSVASLGDLNSDGITDLAVGVVGDDTGGADRGAVHMLLLNANGTVKSSVKIASGLNGGPTLANDDGFGISVASLGDLDGDGVTDLAVGAFGDDTGGDRRGAVHVLFLKLPNQPPIITSSATASVAENTTSVLTVMATDADVPVQTLSFSIVGGADQNKFYITSGGVLTLKSASDFENPTDVGTDPPNPDNTYEVTVKVTDGSGRTATKPITVTITDVNDVTPVVTASQSFSVAENSAATTAVGTVLATDGDVTATTFQSWTITAGNTDQDGDSTLPFAINASTGAITVNDAGDLDREQTTSFTLSVTVSDGVNTSAVQTLTINLTDVNDVTPVVTAGQTINVSENSEATTSVGTVLAIDDDGTATAFQSWTITAGNTDKDGDSTLPFAMNASTGTITVNDAGDLDREQTTSFTLSVTVSDGVHTSTAQTVVVNVTDVNEFNPSVSGGPFSVAENSANGTPVGTVSGSDSDATNGVLSYSITGGNSLSIFAIDSSTGAITVADKTNLDREVISSVTLTVQVSDNGPGSARTDSTNVTINVSDVNEFNPVLDGANFTVSEKSANGTAVGALTATDADATKSISYSITAGNSFGVFAIDSSTGAITIADKTNLEQESLSPVSLTVQVSDSGPATARTDTATMTINVIEVNDTPTGVNDLLPSVAEDSSVRVISFEELLNNDVKGPSNEIGQTLTITAVSNPVGGTVAINSTNVEFTPMDNFHGLASFMYTLQDNGTTNGVSDFLTNTANVFFTVTEVNDVPGFAAGANVGRPGDGVQKTVLGWATNISRGPVDEAGQTLSFVVTTNNDSLFATNGTPTIDPSTGNLTFTPKAVVPTTGTATVTVRLHDNGGGTAPNVDTSAAQTFTITLTGLNKIPTFKKGANQTVLEDSAQKTVANWATAISAGAGDVGQAVTFEVTDNTNTALFSEQPTISPTGVLTYTPMANAKGSAKVTVILKDDAGTNGGGKDASASTTFTITVTAVNDVPVRTAGTLPTINVDEDSANGTAMTLGLDSLTFAPGPATATDETTQTLAYKITAIPKFVKLFKADGTRAVNLNGTVTAAELQGLKYKTVPNLFGTGELKFAVTDNGSGTAPNVNLLTETLSITVNPINDLPTISNIADQTTNEDTPTAAIKFTVDDVENKLVNLNAVIVTAISLNTNLVPNDPANIVLGGSLGSRTIQLKPLPDQSGITTITITATDSSGATATDTFVLKVTAVNDAPRITIATLSVTELLVTNNDIVGTVTAVDPEGDTITAFAITGGNTGNAFKIGNNGVLQVADATKIDFEALAKYTLIIKAIDALGHAGSKATETGPVTINVENHSVNLTVVAVDADNTVTVSKIGNNLVARRGGVDVITPRPLEDVASLTITGGIAKDIVVLDASLNSAGSPATHKFVGQIVVNGNEGDDKLDASKITVATFGITFNGGLGNDSLLGGSGNDVLNGGDGNDTIKGGAGKDTIDGGDGNDKLRGGDGDDSALGGLGNDLLSGDAGLDILNGNEGDDSILGGAGNDQLFGGLGTDQLFGQDGNDVLTGGADADSLSGGTGTNTTPDFAAGLDTIGAFSTELTALLAALP